MAHDRKRHLKSTLQKALNFAPVVGVIGHRQVGKTTLVSGFGVNYTSLDDLKLRELANRDPKKFLKKRKSSLMIIDECQKAPPLFDAIKEEIRVNQRPGQLLLTGSVRFTSKKMIRESLTGRIINLELLPLTISELANRSLSGLSLRILEANSGESLKNLLLKNASPLCPLKVIHQYENSGGLPGICFIRDSRLRDLRMQEYFSTILDRDLREVCQTNLPYSQIFDFLKTLAEVQGEPIDHTFLRSRTQISVLTQKKILAGLESVFLIRLLKIEGGRKGFVCFLEDHFESLSLANQALNQQQHFTQLLYRNVRAEFFYSLGKSFRIFHYLTKHNTTLPFAIQVNEGCLGFLPLEKANPSHGEQMAAQSFLRNFRNSKVVFVHRDAELEVVSTNSILISDRYFY
jgi:predicted AAA+ superfamily ATPase